MTIVETEASPPTTEVTIAERVRDVRRCFDGGRTRSYEWRVRQLEGVIAMIDERKDEIHRALHADLGKSDLEAHAAETNFVRNGAVHLKKMLRKWMKPEPVTTPLVTKPSRAMVVNEPLGVVLVIAPWNYPFHLSVAPLCAALAAGNCAIVKPSEIAPATSALLASLLPRYVDPQCVRVIEGAIPETTELLRERFDHIFYTGNGHVGRIIMRAAAEHLTPVTLELGGKSPCVVDRDADLDVVARRIAFGKFYNAGQTCVAPDYVLAHEEIYDALVQRLRQTVLDFYRGEPKNTPDFARIVSERHFDRILALLEGSEVVIGGESDRSERYIAPTILGDVSPEAKVMQEEIFGPILPVLRTPSVEDAIAFINGRDKPLALYVFSRNEAVNDRVIAATSSGAVVVNHVFLHMAVEELPFGGVGESGIGAYHGRAGFDTFSHRKSVLVKGQRIDPSILYPPYDATKEKWVKRLV
ncbi:MAG: aldehyde dehydrogenase family protein [Myxococcota bacterium]